jgi:hypothetical protein
MGQIDLLVLKFALQNSPRKLESSGNSCSGLNDLKKRDLRYITSNKSYLDLYRTEIYRIRPSRNVLAALFAAVFGILT